MSATHPRCYWHNQLTFAINFFSLFTANFLYPLWFGLTTTSVVIGVGAAGNHLHEARLEQFATSFEVQNEGLKSVRVATF